MSKYGELLKDPRWQQKRLQILNRDKWTCQLCGRKDETLNVHHMWYGEYPWVVQNSLLITLCEKCHEIEEGVPSRLTQVFKMFSGHGILRMDMMNLCIAALEYADRRQANDNKRADILKAIEAIKTMK